MKLLVQLSTLFVLAKFSPAEDIFNWNIHEPLSPLMRTKRADESVKASDIKYTYYRQGSSQGTVIRSTDVTALRSTRFDPNLETVFIIHGWTIYDKFLSSERIRDAFLKNHDVNIFVVDWTKYSGLDYLSAQDRVQAVGRLVAEFIQQTVRVYGVDLNRVRIVGFSLGAHIAGSAGESLQGRVASIVGLDPAGPGFHASTPGDRLDPTDARYVQVIHTNAGMFGADFSMGHSDYWPNGGKSQPGCILDLVGICSHNKAYAYYAESLEINRFVSRKCTNYSSYRGESCNGNEASQMGGLHPDTRASGNYYLSTNSRSPFGKN